MMKDLSINFYEVCKEADKYFETHDRNVKGSGWKGYQRWRNANEAKYYPSGQRDNIDPFFAANAYQEFLKNTPNQQNKSLFNNGWEELGPFRIDSISGHYSAGLGQIIDHYVAPNNANIMYVGSRSGGFWKTTDGGTNWQGGSTDFLPATGVNTIAVSPSNSDSILINIQNAKNSYSHGIYRSTNGGNSWVQSNFNPTTANLGGLGSDFTIYKIIYHPRVPNLIFIGTNQGLFRSTNNLATWTLLLTSSDITDIAFHPTNNNIIYVYDNYYWGTNRSLVLRSTNQGLNFSSSATIAGNNDQKGHLSVSNACPNCLYFASDEGVWKSTNNGIDFTLLASPPQDCGGFAVNDLDTSYMIYGYVEIEASADGGRSWNQKTDWYLPNTNGFGNIENKFRTSSNYVHADLHPAKCVNGVFYVGTDGFFSKSTDNGTTWQKLSQGVATRENYKLGVSQSNQYRSISGSQDNGTSIKHQDNWLEFYGADGMEGIIHPLNDDWMIGSVQFGARRRTKDGGRTQDEIPTPSSSDGYWEAPIAYAPSDPMTIYDFKESIYKSTNFGNTWDSVGIPTTFTGTIEQAAIAENNSNIIVISNGDYIEKSTNGGRNFINIKHNLPSYYIEDIAFDPSDDNTFIVVNRAYQNNNNKIYITTNGGTSWTNITHNLGRMPIHSVVIDHTPARNIYVGAEIGVYTKPMNGSTWILYSPDLPNVAVEELEIVYGSNTLKAATWGRGLWEYTLVGRDNYPAIVNTTITTPPTDRSPLFGVPQYVTSAISYTQSLSSVYVKWSAFVPMFNNTINMTNTIDSTWVSNTALPNYPIGTKLYFKVFAIGNHNDTTETYQFMYTVKQLEYCLAAGSTNQLYLTDVRIANIHNTTGSDGFTYYQDSVIRLEQNRSYTISVEASDAYTGNDFFAWLDFNQDTIFDSSEAIMAVLDDTTDNASVSFTVPANTVINDTLLLRIRVSYYGTPSPCGTTLGEVEDYPVIIYPPLPNLGFNIASNSLCQNDSLRFNYTGDAVDSILWTFSNGSNRYTSRNFNGSLAINSSGSFDLHLVAYSYGRPISLDSSNLFVVYHYNDTIHLTTCNPNNVSTISNTFSSNIGCDSTVTTITSLLAANINLHTDTLVANPNGLNYQWLDCNANFAVINGATSRIFVTGLNGSFAVEITNGSCIDTSACEQVIGLGIMSNNFDNEIKLYPNPTDGLVAIDMGIIYPKVKIIVTNELGQVLINKTIAKNKMIAIDLENYTTGVYFVQITAADKKATFKLIKK